MAGDLHDHPDWAAVRAAQSAHGRDLVTRYGAHGLDIQWVERDDGARVPGLVLHVADLEAAADVPATLACEVDGHTIEVPLAVAEAPPTTFER